MPPLRVGATTKKEEEAMSIKGVLFMGGLVSTLIACVMYDLTGQAGATVNFAGLVGGTALAVSAIMAGNDAMGL